MKIEPDVRIVLMHRTCAEEGAMSFKYETIKKSVLVFWYFDNMTDIFLSMKIELYSRTQV